MKSHHHKHKTAWHLRLQPRILIMALIATNIEVKEYYEITSSQLDADE
jgi:hypothetical protein